MPIAAMCFIPNENNPLSFLSKKEWLTSTETLEYVKAACPTLWQKYFCQYSDKRQALYAIRDNRIFGISFEKRKTLGSVRAIFVEKATLDRAEALFKYRLNIAPLNAAIKQKQKQEESIKEALENVKYWSDRLSALMEEKENNDMQSTIKALRTKAKKDNRSIGFCLKELEELSGERGVERWAQERWFYYM